MEVVKPTRVHERIQLLDVFRGFAIFGIFMVNILVMNISFLYREEWEAEQVGWLQVSSTFILEEFFYGKFFTIFSFLFGLGVAFQMAKAKEKDQFSNFFFIRRFFALFFFGIAHILFVWSGDILHIYGALGFLLIFLFRLKANTMAIFALLVFLFPYYFQIFTLVVNEYVGFDHMAALGQYSRDQLSNLKHTGSYLSGIPLRLKEYSFVMQYVYCAMIPAALAMMLIGGFFFKKGFLDNVSLWVKKGKLAAPVGFTLFLTYKLVLAHYIRPNFEIEPGTALSLFLMTIYYLADLVISLCYLWFIGFLFQFDFWKKLLSPLGAVGRMALTNYIAQSIIGYVIMRTFKGYDNLSFAQCVAIVLIVFLFQVLLSRKWLEHFRFGPLEWMWRCFSYGKLLPIR
jgi:uncharacterized protein